MRDDDVAASSYNNISIILIAYVCFHCGKFQFRSEQSYKCVSVYSSLIFRKRRSDWAKFVPEITAVLCAEVIIILWPLVEEKSLRSSDPSADPSH